MTSWRVDRDDGGWSLQLHHATVHRCTSEPALTLELRDGDDAGMLRIEGRFVVTAGSVTHRLDAEKPADLDPARALVGQRIAMGRVLSAGLLEIRFEDGRILRVPPDDDFEAWELSGPRGMRVVCAPGGEISVWQPTG
jgi:hypothetical protein